MNKKIRNVWILTMVSAVVLICLQTYWLLHEMTYSVSQRENAAITAIDKAYQDYTDLCSMEYKLDNHAWNFTALVGKDENDITCNCVAGNAKPEEIILTEDTFRLPQLGVNDAQIALMKLLVNKKTPFNKARLDSLIRQRTGTDDFTTRIDTLKDFRFFSDTIRHASITGGRLVLFYPLDPLAYRGLTVDMAVDVNPTLAAMRWQLAATVLLTVLLIASLVYQIKVILYQRHIDRMRSDFVHTMIHELKRPVQMLRMCISMFGRDGRTGETDNKEMTAIVREETDNLMAYLAKLRDVIRAEEHIPLSCSPFNLHEMIDTQVAATLHSVKDKDVDISVRYELDTETVTADRSQLANVLGNLLENACKYSGENVRIMVTCRKSEVREDCFDLEVSDNGIGIPASEQGKVFQKFYRGASSEGKSVPGIGLGLSFVRMIAEAHGGTAVLRSRENKGTTVTVTIPYAKA